MILIKLLAASLWLLVFSFASCSAAFASEKSEPKKPLFAVRPEDIPGVIVAYGLFSTRYDEFKALESYPQNVVIRLGKALDALDVDLSTRLAFSHRALIVQNKAQGNVYGFIRVKGKTLEESGVPTENILFVTTPVDALKNRVLVIFSSLGPDRTTVLAIDSNLDAQLLYDSFKKSIGGKLNLGSLYAVRVVSEGRFVMEERVEPGGRGFASPHSNRTFIIDVTDGIFKMFPTR